MSGAEVRTMTRAELLRRKAELELIIEVLANHDLDSACRELGEVDYLLG